jgi:hypothetical protein
MNSLEAKEKIKFSLSQGTKTPCPKNEDRDMYIAQKADELLMRIIEPVLVNVTSAMFPEHFLKTYQSQKVWAIARQSDNWLLTLSSEPAFALAFGTDPSSLSMLGFSSTDVLAEWLG